MLKNLTKKQIQSLLELLDTLSNLGLTPGYSVIHTLRSRTVLDMRWNITREDDKARFGVHVRDYVGSKGIYVLDIIEDDV